MNPLRSVGAKLSLALALLIAAALAAVYAVVVPSLERHLVDAKVSQLERAAPSLARQAPRDPIGLEAPNFLENASASANARVVVFQTVSLAPPAVGVLQDSNGVSSADVNDDPVALRAAATLRPAAGTVTRGTRRYAEAAVPVPGAIEQTLLLSADLHDSLGNVGLVRRRLLIAGLLALLAAVALGYGGATLLAHRLRRLERAADRIARGDFEEPVEDTRADEIGQLARAFERMREQLFGLDHARREFVANASHELRTPIFSLGGFLELLDDEELDESTQREFLQTMREQVVRLTKLAAELLDLSRLDAGRLRVEAEPVDLLELSHSLVEDFHGLARSSGHELVAAADLDVTALGDERRVRQIGEILVENALLHTPAGTLVHVRAAYDRGGAEIAVEDNGPGVPSDQAENVFERFFRVEGSVASGSGLGLAIARELAERMGGAVELESEPGRTVFRLLLPRAPAEDAFSRENARTGAERATRT